MHDFFIACHTFSIYFTRNKLEDIKELQKMREKPKGVSSVGLALGKKISQTEDVDSVSIYEGCPLSM